VIVVVELEKLTDYCLNQEHPRGRHKARVFASVLNIRQSDAQFLGDALLHAAAANDAVLIDADEYGLEMHGPAGTATVRSLWIVRSDEDVPRLTSCYVK
jgi:hypothetical protein